MLSLAMSDLLVCLVVMPASMMVLLTDAWPLPVAWCVFYLTCDVLACSVSILHLMFISLAR